MPEFHLNTEGTGAPWESLDAFTQGFIEAAFFCENSHIPASQFFTKASQRAIEEGQSDGNIPNGARVANIDRDSFCKVKDFCDAFQTKHADLLQRAYELGEKVRVPAYDESQAGRDLYFTYAGHGVGFWDRGLGDIGDALSKACERGEINLSAYRNANMPDGYSIAFYIG